jgi:hypothetical protein
MSIEDVKQRLLKQMKEDIACKHYCLRKCMLIFIYNVLGVFEKHFSIRYKHVRNDSYFNFKR